MGKKRKTTSMQRTVNKSFKSFKKSQAKASKKAFGKNFKK